MLYKHNKSVVEIENIYKLGGGDLIVGTRRENSTHISPVFFDVSKKFPLFYFRFYYYVHRFFVSISAVFQCV